jgi:hypothetical protein
MNNKSNEVSILEQVLEQPIGNENEVELLPFGESQTFYMEREIDLKFQFIENKTRCGSQTNNQVKLIIRLASGTRDSLGFVFDNAVLSKLETALNGATMTTSCEELCIFAATMVKDNSRTPLKWISVAAITDFPGMISFTWKEREEMPSVKLLKYICDVEAAAIKRGGGTAYKIERQTDASPLLRGCRHD